MVDLKISDYGMRTHTSIPLEEIIRELRQVGYQVVRKGFMTEEQHKINDAYSRGYQDGREGKVGMKVNGQETPWLDKDRNR